MLVMTSPRRGGFIVYWFAGRLLTRSLPPIGGFGADSSEEYTAVAASHCTIPMEELGGNVVLPISCLTLALKPCVEHTSANMFTLIAVFAFSALSFAPAAQGVIQTHRKTVDGRLCSNSYTVDQQN